MKKYISVLLTAALAASLCACGGSAKAPAGTDAPAETAAESTAAESPAPAGESTEAEKAETRELKIVTTIFPEYDWVREVLGEEISHAELTMLLDSGVDLHSYQPTAKDIMKISTCDMFVYVGGESDGWVDDALKEAVNPDMKVINLLETLGDKAKEEEAVEGMEADHDHEHEEGEEHDHEHEGPEYDEHVWLSLRNAEELVNVIADNLGEIDGANADTYMANAEAYSEKLAALDKEYRDAADKGQVKTLLFGDRFPFRYLTDDYGLDYYAAFMGCSAETEASFETITFLAQKTDELALPCVMTIEGTDHRIAETVVGNTAAKNQKILTMDSMQSVTAKDVEAGATYLGIMEKNLEVFREALAAK